MRQTTFYGWKMLAVLWFVLFANFAFPLTGSSVINAYMARGLHFDRSTLGFAYAAFYWLHGIPAPLIAICVTRKGVRFTLTMGGALVAGGVSDHGHSGAYQRASGRCLRDHDRLGCCGRRYSALASGGRAMVRQEKGPGDFSASNRVRHRGDSSASSAQPSDRGVWGKLACRLAGGFRVERSGNPVDFVVRKERPSDVGQEPDGGLALANSGNAGAKVSQRFYQTAENWTFAEILRSPTMWLLLIASLGYSTGFPAFLAHGVVHLEGFGAYRGRGCFFALCHGAFFSDWPSGCSRYRRLY